MCRILSGVFQDGRSALPSRLWFRIPMPAQGVQEMETIYRPSHADFTYQAKYGIRNWQEAGAHRPVKRSDVSPLVLWPKTPQDSLPADRDFSLRDGDSRYQSRGESGDRDSLEVEANVVRCPDTAAAAKMIERIKQVHAKETLSVVCWRV